MDTDDQQILPPTKAVDMTECKGGGSGGNRLQLNSFKFIQYLRTSMNPSVLTLKGGSFTQMKKGSGNGVSLSSGALAQGTWTGGPCTVHINAKFQSAYLIYWLLIIFLFGYTVFHLFIHTSKLLLNFTLFSLIICIVYQFYT